MPINGLDIQKASHELKVRGLKTGSRSLRLYMIEIGAIRKTAFGYEVTDKFKERGLFETDTRQHLCVSETGMKMTRHYSVVLITDKGLWWLYSKLRDAIPKQVVSQSDVATQPRFY